MTKHFTACLVSHLTSSLQPLKVREAFEKILMRRGPIFTVSALNATIVLNSRNLSSKSRRLLKAGKITPKLRRLREPFTNGKCSFFAYFDSMEFPKINPLD